MLDFVDDHHFRIMLQKAFWIAIGSLPYHDVVERAIEDVPVRQLPGKRRLTHLPRALKEYNASLLPCLEYRLCLPSGKH